VPSATAGTKIITDGEGGGQANSEEWFPAVAVDQSTGGAVVDVYSTRDDSTRKTMHVYTRPVGPTATVGTLTKVSTLASDYSNATCCTFGNDYGDYNGIDAAGGAQFIVWSDKSQADGEVFFQRLGAPSPPAPLNVTGDAFDESETFVTAVPNDTQRVLVGANGGLTDFNAWISTNGGTSFTERAVPTTIDIPGTTPPPPPPPPPPAPVNLPPTASLRAPARATAGRVTFDASGSTDPDGTIVRYHWDADRDPANGFEVDTGAVPTLVRTLAAGNHTMGVQVTDSGGANAQATASVLVRPVARVRLVGSGGRVKVRRGRFSVSLTGCSACTGRVSTTTGKRVSVGSKSYRLSAGGKAVVTITLSKAARRLLAKNGSIKVALKITVSNGAGSTATARGSKKLVR
jgi:K319-like protein